jgi:hypothetical protein
VPGRLHAGRAARLDVALLRHGLLDDLALLAGLLAANSGGGRSEAAGDLAGDLAEDLAASRGRRPVAHPRHRAEAHRGTPRHTEAYSSGGGGASTRRRRPVGQCACTACAVGNPVGRMGAPRPLGLLCTYCRGRAAARCHRAAAGCRRAGAGPGPGQAGPGRAGPEMCTSRRAAICRTSACAEERCDVCSSSDWGGVRGEGWGV